jgi:universal stress protein E
MGKRLIVMNTHILVIADKTDSEPLSLQKAQHIAAPLNSQVDVVKFIPELKDSHELSVQIEHSKQCTGELIESIFDKTTYITNQIVPTDNIARWVTDNCEQNNIDIVIKTGHRSETLFHKSTDFQLIDALPCPLLIASDHKWKSESTIFAIVDLSGDETQRLALNKQVLEWAKTFTKATDCSLHIAYCIPVFKPLMDLEVFERSEYEKKHKPKAQRKLNALLDQYNISDATTHITVGPTDKAISHLSNELKADLVIIGSMGSHGVKGFLLGNTAERVLHHLRTDILIVKT